MKNSSNQGIQGTHVNITADALAVGSRARAISRSKSVVDAPSAAAAVNDLAKAIAALELTDEARAKVAEPVTELASVVADPAAQPSRVASLLDALAARLASVGVIATNVAAIAAPLVKVARLFGVPLPNIPGV